MLKVKELLDFGKVKENIAKELSSIKTSTVLSKEIADTVNLASLIGSNLNILDMYVESGVYSYIVDRNTLTIEEAVILHKHLVKLHVALTKNLTANSTKEYRDCICSLQIFLIHLSPFVDNKVKEPIGRYVLEFMSKLTLGYRSDIQSILQNDYKKLFDYIATPSLLELTSLLSFLKGTSNKINDNLKDILLRIIVTQIDSLPFMLNNKHPFDGKEMETYLDNYKINLLACKVIVVGN